MTTLRRTRSPQPAPPLSGDQLPFDVRLLNGVASAVFALVAAALVAAGALWLARAPLFAIRTIDVAGDLSHNSVQTIRANAMPQLQGNFFSLRLQRARAAFESVPWVRQAVVRRVWPDRLLVQLQEHRAAAIWQGDVSGDASAGSDKLVNTHGEVFEANIGDVEDDSLPTLAGPDGSAAQMLAVAERLRPVLQTLQLDIDTLHLSGRGSWRVELDSGAVVELGRGSEAELLARAERFVHTLPQVTARLHQPLQYADLRHADGYAVRLAGVTTTTATAATTAARKPPAKPVAAQKKGH